MFQLSTRTVRITLGLILFGGLLLRLWGIRWGLDADQGLHPDEWPFIVIVQLSRLDFSEIGTSVWYNVYHFIAALVALGIQKGAYFFGAMFNLFRLEEEVPLNFILIGRIASALLGTLTIYLVYRAGRFLFDHDSAGLLAALIVAITPLNVAQAHFLETDVPLAFMAVLCFLGTFNLLKRPKKANFFLAGLLYGLTFSTKPNGLLLALPLLVVLFYLVRENPTRAGIRALFPKMLLFAGATLLGILLGAPGLILQFSNLVLPVIRFLWDLSEIKPGSWTGHWLEGPQASRFGLALHSLREGFGLPWMILAALGVGYFLYRRERAGLVLLSFPLGYFTIVGLWGRRFGERDLVVIMPFLALVIAGLLVRIFHRPGGGRWRGWVLAIVVLVLSVQPLWNSLQLVYYYWQDDNRILAQQWITRNLPPGSALGLDGYSPNQLNFPLDALDYRKPPDILKQEFDYLVTSSMDTDRFFSVITGGTNDPEGRHILSLQKNFQLLKEFDLGYSNAAAKHNGSYNFPDFVDPLIRVYSTRAAAVRVPLFFPRLAAESQKKYSLSFTNRADYEKDTAAFFIPPHSLVKRLLRSEKPLERVLLILSNGPQTKTKLTISAGGWPDRLELDPREVKAVLITPRRSFPYIRNLYGITIRAEGQGNVWGQLLADPYRIGVHLLHFGRTQEALPFLVEAVAEQPDHLERRAYLAAAQAALKDVEGARKSFREIETRDPIFWSRYLQLALNDLPYLEWLRHFAAETGYYHPLLRQATRYRHVVSPDVRFFTLNDKQETKGENFVAASQTEPDGTPAVKLWSGELFPRGPYRALFRIKFHSHFREGPRLIRVDVLKHAHEGLVTLGEKKIVGHGTPTAREDVEEFVIPFDNPVFGGNFEFRVFALDKKTEFTLQEVEVFLDLRQFLQNSLKSFLAAWEKVEDKTGRGPVPPSVKR